MISFVLWIGIPSEIQRMEWWWKIGFHTNSFRNIGVVLSCRGLEGVGVVQDNIYAHMWGYIATSNGNENGATLTDIAASEMTYDDISAAQKLARECLAKNYKDC